MLVVMQSRATTDEIRAICERIESLGFRAHSVEGTQRYAIAVTGDLRGIETWGLEELPGVQEIIRISKPYKLVSRESKPENTIVRFPNSDVTIGGEEFAIIAGPCSVESRSQTLTVAEKVAVAGARLFRGGAYKPRTSPYAFQGMGVEGLKILAEVRERFGMLIVTEAVDTEALDAIEDYADMIQIGARNMQNFSLLKRAGRSPLPVLLKRGLSATLEELLMAAEYIMSEGNRNVVLCERGVRTFADHSRNTLDLSVIPAAQKLSHLPIISDPSHGTGKTRPRGAAGAGFRRGGRRRTDGGSASRPRPRTLRRSAVVVSRSVCGDGFATARHPAGGASHPERGAAEGPPRSRTGSSTLVNIRRKAVQRAGGLPALRLCPC